MPIGVPSGLVALVGAELGATWQDRLREAAYTSPSGTRIKLVYEDVSRSVEARGTVWEFAGVDGAYVQQTGHGARAYPLRVFFTGANHDRVADAFLAALLEPGSGRLEHPRYGPVSVRPLGTITQRDDLKTGANQTIFDVPFLTSLEGVYPSSDGDAENEILAALGNFDVELAQRFEESASLAAQASRANLASTIRGFLRDTSAALQTAADAVASVRREFADAVSIVNYGIDVFIGQPLLLARQVSDLIKAPARALAGIESRLEGYAALAASIFGSSAGSPASTIAAAAVPSSLTKAANDFQASNLFAMNAVAGMVLSTLEHEFRTRPEALGAAARILGQFDELVAWRDAGFAALTQVDSGGAYQALHQAVALTVGRLVEASFTLVPERRIVIDRPRTIIDLAAELYGSVDDRLNLLISSNDLTGSEILELPRGSTIVYYPS
jgi:hypothetical protein